VKDYLQFVEREGVWSSGNRGGSLNTVVPGLLRLGKGILCAALHLYFTAYFPVAALESAWFPRMNFLRRCDLVPSKSDPCTAFCCLRIGLEHHCT